MFKKTALFWNDGFPYWTYFHRKKPSSDCIKFSTLAEKEWRARITRQGLTGGWSRALHYKVGAGLIWSSYLIFSGNESALYCLQECGRGKARLTEGESFNVWELYKRKWVLLLSKGLKEMRRGISSPKSAGKRWDLVNIHFWRQGHYHNPGARILSVPVHWQFLKWAFHGLVWIVRCYFLEPFHYKISVIHLQDDARATVRPPGKNQAEEENRVNNWLGIMKCKKLLVTKDRWLLKNVSEISYQTYFHRKEPSSDCNKLCTLVEKEWRGWRSTKGLAGESLRLEPSSPLWGARWIELMFLFNFLRKGICTL